MLRFVNKQVNSPSTGIGRGWIVVIRVVVVSQPLRRRLSTAVEETVWRANPPLGSGITETVVSCFTLVLQEGLSRFKNAEARLTGADKKPVRDGGSTFSLWLLRLLLDACSLPPLRLP